jgi:quinolinate synthase
VATKLATTAIPFEQYFSIDDEACDKRIDAAKQKLGDDLVILGHHYQRN